MHDLFPIPQYFEGKKKEKSEQSDNHFNRNSRHFFFWIEGKRKPQFNTILTKSKYTFHTVLLTMELEIQVKEKEHFYLSWILILKLRTIFLGLVLLSPIAEWWRWLLAYDLKMKFYPSADFPNPSRDQCSDIICFKRRYDIVHYRL